MRISSVLFGLLLSFITPHLSFSATCTDTALLNRENRAYCQGITQKNCNYLLDVNGNNADAPLYKECMAFTTGDCETWLADDENRMAFCQAILERNCNLLPAFEGTVLTSPLPFRFCISIMEGDCNKYLTDSAFHKASCELYKNAYLVPNRPNDTTRVTPDSDDDGIPDITDNCMRDKNPIQTDQDIDTRGDVCDPDLDGDDVSNDADNCPYLVNRDQADTDRDGVGDLCQDSDGDTFLDIARTGQDNCPFVVNYDQRDGDTDKLGDLCDPDDDNDTVADASDDCPYVANTNQADADRDGIGDVCETDDPTILTIITDPFIPSADKSFYKGDTLRFFPVYGCDINNKKCPEPSTYTYKWTFSKTPAPTKDKPNKKVFEYEGLEDVSQDAVTPGTTAPNMVLGWNSEVRYTFNWASVVKDDYEIKLCLTFPEKATAPVCKTQKFTIEGKGSICGQIEGHWRGIAALFGFGFLGLIALLGLRSKRTHH